ncbi:hypothetical protein BCEP27_70400 [Burkholderia cepacia]
MPTRWARRFTRSTARTPRRAAPRCWRVSRSGTGGKTRCTRWRRPRRRLPSRVTIARWPRATRASSTCMPGRMHGSRRALKIGHLFFCVSDDASWQAGGRFPHAMRGGTGHHGEHEILSPCRARRRAARFRQLCMEPGAKHWAGVGAGALTPVDMSADARTRADLTHRQESHDEDESRDCMEGGRTADDRGSRSRRAARRRSADRGEGDGHLPHRLLHAVGRRSGRDLPGDPRP